jgi:hypothetical protein
MRLDEYKALCLKYLGGAWLSEPEAVEYIKMLRQNYLTGGWSEKELDDLAVLHALHALQDFAASEEEAESMVDFWTDLPIGDELKREVMRKAILENGLEILESVDETNLNQAQRSAYKKRLAEAREAVVAASLGILPGMPEYDAWMRKEGLEP